MLWVVVYRNRHMAVVVVRGLTRIEGGNISKGSLIVVHECMGVADYRQFITRNHEDFGK